MDQRATYLLQILEAIGAPLMGAITDVSGGAENTQGEAQSMAALLAKTVEASIELGNIMDINPTEAQDDTLRVALAGLAGPLVAGQYAKRGQVPESPDLKKITSALQAVLTFSDNFTPTPETVERLKNLEASGQTVDTYQTQIQYMQAFIPVVEAIAAFPFGQAEAKLIMDVSDRLVKRSVELREALLPGVGDEATQKRAELGLLKALALLYSACHRAETEKVTSTDIEAQGSALSIDPVWKAFDMRAAMLEALAANMVPGGAESSGGSSKAPAVPASAAAPATPPPATPPAQPPTETPQAATPPAEAPPAQPPPKEPPAAQAPPAEAPATPPPPAQPPAQPQEQGANPMAMFAKPKTDTGQAASPPPATPPPAAPPAEAPPTSPPAAQPPPTETPPPATPPAQPPTEGGEGDQDGGNQGGDGNPMSFFKKGE